MTEKNLGLEVLAKKDDNLCMRACSFHSLSGAKKSFSEIDAHDVAPSEIGHVKNLSQCSCCIVTNMFKHGNDYEIQFSVGYQAVQEAVNFSQKLNTICEQIG